MTREEFRDLVGREVSNEDFEIIEKVYLFHPAVNEVSGKEEVAKLYKSFGMDIFYDLFPRAERNRELKRKLNNAQEEITRIKEEMKKPLWGDKMEMGKGEENSFGKVTFQFTVDLSKVNDLPTLYWLIDKLKECAGGEDGEVQG